MIGLKRNTIKVVDYDPDWVMLALEAVELCGMPAANFL